MYIFLAILFLAFPFIQGILNENKYEKFSMLNIFFLFFALIQFILAPYTITATINYQGCKILTILLVVLWCCGLIVLFAYLFKTKKITINKQIILASLKNNYIFYIFFIALNICMLFMRNIFMDTTAYMAISGYFKNNLYTFEGIDALSLQYRCATQYFAYSVLSSNPAPFYLFFNNFIYSFLLFYIVNDYGWKYWWTKIIGFVSIFTLIIAWSYASTGGNMILQATLVLTIIYLLSKNDLMNVITYFLFLMFFSVTGLVLSVCCLVGLIIYTFIFKSRKEALTMLWWAIVILLPYATMLIAKWSLGLYFAANTAKVYIPIIFNLITIALGGLYYFVNKINFKNDTAFVENAKWKFAFYTIGIIFAVASMVLWGVIYPKTSGHDGTYQHWLSYVSGVTIILLSIYNMIAIKKDNEEIDFTMPMIFLMIISTIAVFFLSVVPIDKIRHNASLWRISYMNICFGTMSDIVLCLLIIINKVINVININKDKVKKLLPWTLSTPLLIGAIAAPLSFTQQPVYNGISLSSGSTNVTKNVAALSAKDIKALNDLHINSDDEILSSVRVMQVLGKGKNENNFIVDKANKVCYVSPWVINAYGFIGAVEYVNQGISDKIDSSETNVVDLLNNWINASSKKGYIFMDKTRDASLANALEKKASAHITRLNVDTDNIIIMKLG